MSSYIVWVACSGTGQYQVFKAKPIRNYETERWQGERDNYAQVALYYLEGLGIPMPELKWDDEPMKVEISANYG